MTDTKHNMQTFDSLNFIAFLSGKNQVPQKTAVALLAVDLNCLMRYQIKLRGVRICTKL